ncbi:SubName: Full=Uncharacterized protein {ECO:0000313/EMBL:CCA70018.1} [Serendipita indica DSM 11827]|nr:SubName: Full=Uncharacterized protein {ECO:0000313/EMBL:CCA70018.1} [Serendipita indica DSM 11827]
MSLTKSLVAGATFAAALTAAVFTVCVHFEASGGVHLCRDACTPAVVKEYGIKYGLGVQSIDTFLCHLDAFFRASLESPVLEFTQLFLLSVPVSVFVLLIESMRDDKPLVGFVPLLFTILLQTISGALGGTLFWMPFVVQACFGGSRQAKKTLNQVDVEAALIATVGGYLAPTAWMFLTKDSLAILVWQFFPIYLSILQNGWKFYKRNAPRQPGFDLLQLSLFILSGVGTISWFYILKPHISNSILMDIYNWAPSWSIPDRSTATLPSAALHILQYDALWMFGSAILAGVFLMDTIKEALFAIQTIPLFTLLFGPGAVIGGLWMYREMQLLINEQEAAAKAAAAKKK